jgi:transposase
MRTGSPKVELLLTDEERSQLQSLARSRSLPVALSTRVRIVLGSADGEANNAIAHRLGLTKGTVATRLRWHMHFIPTYSPWLNQVERFLVLITDKAIRRASFTSIKQLVQRIDHFVATHNANGQPFKWTATADSILEKLHRLCSRISGTGH